MRAEFLIQVQINEALRKDIAQVLEQRFGVPAEKQTVYIDSYAQTYFDRSAWVEKTCCFKVIGTGTHSHICLQACGAR